MQYAFLHIFCQLTAVVLVNQMEAVGSLLDILGLSCITLLLKLQDITTHLGQLMVMNLSAHLPLLQ